MSNDDVRLIGKPGNEFRVFQDLRSRLAEKGVDYERLPKLSSIDAPPRCFVHRAGGDVERGRRDYVAWLRCVPESGDLPYRYDMPGEVNYCRDCTQGFKKEAEAAGACQFPGVRFEKVVYLGEAEIVGVSRSAQRDPNTYFVYEDMELLESELPEFIRDVLAEIKSEQK